MEDLPPVNHEFKLAVVDARASLRAVGGDGEVQAGVFVLGADG